METALGWVGFAYTDRGLSHMALPEATEEEARGRLLELAGDTPEPSPERRPAWVGRLREALVDYARGGPSDPASLGVPIDWGGWTAFSRRVAEAAAAIPRGETRSYADLACSAGRPRAARAVGQVMANNRVCLVVPCHRVIASGGGLGGFGGRPDLKERLLRMEGHRPAKRRRAG